MSERPAWECQRSVDVEVPVSFAWGYMTDVRNWNDPPAEFTIEGPFAAGTRGTTRMPGQPANSWTIHEVDPGRGYTIHGAPAADASLFCHWRFDPLSADTTRLTQRLALCGENAASYVSDIRSAFEPHLEPGMRRIAQLMTEAAHDDRSRLADPSC
jgi:Polyketide cyclase / dehydrase and lipid transport